MVSNDGTVQKASGGDTDVVLPEGKPYQLVVLSVLREYLIRELKPYTMTTFEWDPERAIDDWVFINFFGMAFFFFLISRKMADAAASNASRLQRDVFFPFLCISSLT